MLLSVGATLGPYVIDGKLGAGGMGEVYRARDTRLDRLVAIKILPRDVTSDAAARARFDREARTVSALDHPNICALYDVGEFDGAPFLVMQYLNGRTLAEVLRSGPLPLDQVRRIGIEIASALRYAHERHILHRDIKPQNVMLLADGRVKLLDFGIARRDLAGDVHAATTAGLTRTGSILGTLEYMSPEQLSGTLIDGRSDIFSLGLVLYEMATGRNPFVGDTPPLTASAILAAAPPPVEAGSPAAALEPIVKKMLARDPEARYTSMSACIDDLNALATAPVSPPARSPVPRLIAVAAALLLIVLAGVVARSVLANRAVPATPETVAPATPVVSSSLAYWLDVQASPGDPVFASLGDQRLPSGARFRVNVVVPAPGHLYLLGDESPDSMNPTGLSIVFTREVESTVTTDWFVTTDGASTDHLWMVWSAAPLGELAAIAPILNTRDRGIVRDPAVAQRVRGLLARAEADRTAERHDADGVRAIVQADRTVIAHRLELQHG